MALDIVRFDGLKSKDWLIYKYPSDTLMMGGQLIVQEGQVAIFSRGGATRTYGVTVIKTTDGSKKKSGNSWGPCMLQD